MKKLLSLTLAVVMVLGMTTVAFAADAKVSTDIDDWGFDYKNAANSGDGGEGTVLDVANVNPDGTARVYLWAKRYTYDPVDKKDVLDNTMSPVVKSDKITISVSKKTGSEGLGNISLDYDSKDGKQAFIKIKGAKYWVSTKDDVDFEINVGLKTNGNSVKDGGKNAKLEITGTFLNGTSDLEIDADMEEVEVEKLEIFRWKAIEYNKGIEFVVTEDVSLFSRVFANKKYYVNFDETPGDADVALMDQYKDIENFIEFKTIGMSSSEVQFNYGDNMYAYTVDADGALVYVGRTNDLLPYYNKYFVSNKELALPVAEAEEPVEEPVEEPAAVEPEVPADTDNDKGGGDDVAEAPSEANNYNPGTGR